MDQSQLVGSLYNIFYYSAIFMLPPLIVGTVFAFLIGLLQAITQIQEQTLPQTVKILVIGVVLIAFGSSLSAPIYSASDEIFSNFHKHSR